MYVSLNFTVRFETEPVTVIVLFPGKSFKKSPECFDIAFSLVSVYTSIFLLLTFSFAVIPVKVKDCVPQAIVIFPVPITPIIVSAS